MRQSLSPIQAYVEVKFSEMVPSPSAENVSTCIAKTREWKCSQSRLGCSREQNWRHRIGYLTPSWDFRNRECSRNNLTGITLITRPKSEMNSLILSSLPLLTCLMMLNPRRAALLATDLVNGVAGFGNSLSSPFGFLRDALQLLRSLPKEHKHKRFLNR